MTTASPAPTSIRAVNIARRERLCVPCFLRCLWLSHSFMLSSRPGPWQQTNMRASRRTHTCLRRQKHLLSQAQARILSLCVQTDKWLELKEHFCTADDSGRTTEKKKNSGLVLLWSLNLIRGHRRVLTVSLGFRTHAYCISVACVPHDRQADRAVNHCHCARVRALSALSATIIDFGSRDRGWCHGPFTSVGCPPCCLPKGLRLSLWGPYVGPMRPCLVSFVETPGPTVR